MNHETKPSFRRPKDRDELSPVVTLYLLAGVSGGVVGAAVALFAGLSWPWVLLTYSFSGACAIALAAWISTSRRLAGRNRQSLSRSHSHGAAHYHGTRQTVPVATIESERTRGRTPRAGRE